MKDIFLNSLSIPEAQPMDIAVRGYVCRDEFSAQKNEIKAYIKKFPKKRVSKASSWTLVFDTETTTDAAQGLRFGTYQVRKNDNLVQSGIFYDPDNLKIKEIELLKEYANKNELTLLTVTEFIEDNPLAVIFCLSHDRSGCTVSRPNT